MSKNTQDKDTWKISEMATHIPDEEVLRVNPIGDDSISPSIDRIKQLSFQKREEYLNRKEEKPVKKASFSFALVAAMVCLVSITAFAAFGGLELIKDIFGDSAEIIQNEITTPKAVATVEGREFALEALVTDGFVTNMVVSLTGKSPVESWEAARANEAEMTMTFPSGGEESAVGNDLFTLTADTDFRSTGWYPMVNFSTPDKTYFVINAVSAQRFDTAAITLALNAGDTPIELSFEAKNNLGNAVVNFPEGAKASTTTLKQLQVSSMGFMLIGHEDAAAGGLPATHIQLEYNDGKKESMDVEFSPSDETVSGGGGMVIGGTRESTPLVTTFEGSRNPDGELIVTAQFSRIINPDNIAKVLIDGIEYQILK
jgi:hypothetical protein